GCEGSTGATGTDGAELALTIWLAAALTRFPAVRIAAAAIAIASLMGASLRPCVLAKVQGNRRRLNRIEAASVRLDADLEERTVLDAVDLPVLEDAGIERAERGIDAIAERDPQSVIRRAIGEADRAAPFGNRDVAITRGAQRRAVVIQQNTARLLASEQHGRVDAPIERDAAAVHFRKRR